MYIERVWSSDNALAYQAWDPRFHPPPIQTYVLV